ncbi:MAG: ABC transporter permease subunit [Palaeococcus sp.]|uniref:ABC transporter permease subunit n=1 Tax=Palaeococcus sp. (in: euryarchaeotes) TaxID=2820298 RepID=UPI0025E87EB0|nr:ABC transporter permease subunit [Palaeococcus sp. (in: euryarchaeotes)]MCD6559262.1 ABC transporter permease subunit [Palaeococcus sp. (in: euryarchaeotes)]
MKTLFKYEVQEPIKLYILTFFSILVSAVHKVFLLKQMGQFISSSPLFPLPRFFVDMAQFNGPLYFLAAIFIPFIVALSVREERDEGTALSIYALPYSKKAILTIKFISNFLLLVSCFFVVHVLVFFLHFSETPEAAFKSLLAGAPFLLLFYAVVIFYMLSMSSFIAVSSPNMYVAILVSFLILYLPALIGIRTLLPMTSDFLGVSRILFPLSLVSFAAYIIMGNWRDVK